MPKALAVLRTWRSVSRGQCLWGIRASDRTNKALGVLVEGSLTTPAQDRVLGTSISFTWLSASVRAMLKTGIEGEGDPFPHLMFTRTEPTLGFSCTYGACDVRGKGSVIGRDG